MAVDFKKIVKAKTKDIDKEYQERLARCRPVAQKILEMIAAENLPIGDIMERGQGEITILKDGVAEKYENLAIKILTMMLDENLKYSERNFVFQLVRQPYEQVGEKVIRSVDRSFTRANEAKWGKDELDITMKDVHEVLLSIK
jgi:hypothetical protein